MSFVDKIKKQSNHVSTAKKIISERSGQINFFVLEDDRGIENHFYIVQTDEQYEALLKDIEDDKTIVPEKYGFIFFQGVGAEPDKMIDERIREIFEIDN